MKKMFDEEIKCEMRMLNRMGFDNLYNETFEKEYGEYVVTIYFMNEEDVDELEMSGTAYCYEPNVYYLFKKDEMDKEICSRETLEEILDEMKRIR